MRCLLWIAIIDGFVVILKKEVLNKNNNKDKSTTFRNIRYWLTNMFITLAFNRLSIVSFQIFSPRWVQMFLQTFSFRTIAFCFQTKTLRSKYILAILITFSDLLASLQTNNIFNAFRINRNLLSRNEQSNAITNP